MVTGRPVRERSHTGNDVLDDVPWHETGTVDSDRHGCRNLGGYVQRTVDDHLPGTVCEDSYRPSVEAARLPSMSHPNSIEVVDGTKGKGVEFAVFLCPTGAGTVVIEDPSDKEYQIAAAATERSPLGNEAIGVRQTTWEFAIFHGQTPVCLFSNGINVICV